MAKNTVWRWSDMRDQQRNRRAPLDQLMEGWLLAGNFSPKTRTCYKETFFSFVKWARGQGYQGILSEFDPLLVRKWQNHLETEGCSVGTIRAYLAALKSFARYLYDERIVLGKDHQPLNLLAEVKVPKLPKTRPEVYKDDELEKILAGINRHHLYGARNLAVVRVMLDGGLRLNEVCQLRPDDIDWETGAIRVRSETAKRKKERMTYVGRRTLLELHRYLEDYRPKDAVIDELFVDQDGGQLQPNAVRCLLRRLAAKVGLPKITPHKFRRTWATNYRKHGVGDLFDLQQEGGWEDLSIPGRFYLDMDQPREGRPSVMDRWEVERRKGARGRPSKVVSPVKAVKVVGLSQKRSLRGLRRAR